MRTRERIHLARCDYCGRKIAWSPKRRQWLALAPFVDMPGTRLRRRLVCPSKADGIFHDPRASVLDRVHGAKATGAYGPHTHRRIQVMTDKDYQRLGGAR